MKQSPPDPGTQAPDAEVLYTILAAQIKAAIAEMDAPPGNLALVGIHSGGAWLAERLAADLQLSDRLGFVDVSFYRDDYAAKGLHAEVKPTQIPFSVDGAVIVLVDDVLYTGRTTRAAINELFDYGRPARILLAALVDRGGRELPIAADFVAATVPLPTGQALLLQCAADGQLTLKLTTRHA
ncbi:bifunctional pyr operon transcriptional regulator/uracil phosphoribosyltransferase PyrR [Herminiimonas sp. CN]|uniref:bifunctional pyr operon transcriptional regulator/uracil phosphoribosyltransferase PyrR n=1 Tax=Herminiimonas sp. CN TaxID=1349818 RepID=UPI00047360C5|nr:bifunctional pyr operon transcriptional regulator/uracil phosphoribosyltransferase PyrR [Herminiimonas sp. CN]